jgi:hypothetical protein
MALMTSLSLIAMSPFAEEPPPITLSDGQTPSSIVIIGPSNWLLTLTFLQKRKPDYSARSDSMNKQPEQSA